MEERIQDPGAEPGRPRPRLRGGQCQGSPRTALWLSLTLPRHVFQLLTMLESMAVTGWLSTLRNPTKSFKSACVGAAGRHGRRAAEPGISTDHPRPARPMTGETRDGPVAWQRRWQTCFAAADRAGVDGCRWLASWTVLSKIFHQFHRRQRVSRPVRTTQGSRARSKISTDHPRPARPMTGETRDGPVAWKRRWQTCFAMSDSY